MFPAKLSPSDNCEQYLLKSQDISFICQLFCRTYLLSKVVVVYGEKKPQKTIYKCLVINTHFLFHILDRLKLKNPSKKLVSKNLLSIGRYNCTETSLISLYIYKNLFSLFQAGSYYLKSIFFKMCTLWGNEVSQHLESFLKTQVSHSQLYFTGS